MVESLASEGSQSADRKLRILIVVDGYYPSTGGTELQARLQSRSFAQAGHDVTVLVPRLDRTLPIHDVVDEVEVERISYPRVRILGAVLLYLRFAALLILRRNRYDAVHIHTAHYLAAVAGLVRPCINATVMVKVGGAFEFQGGVLDPALKRQPLRRIANWMLRRVDHMHCISDYTRTMLLAAGYSDSRVRMIPNAVDLQRFKPSDARSADTSVPPVGKVVFVGRLVPIKGLPVLLAAWQQVVAAMPARLLIVGDGPMRAELEASAERLGLGPSVNFAGNLNDVPAALMDANVYVQPSHQEGMPNSVLEAMACGLPIVATRISGNVDLVHDGESGLLIPAGDEHALAAALIALLSDQDHARRMGARSRAIVEQRFAVPSVVAQLLGAYRTKAETSR